MKRAAAVILSLCLMVGFQNCAQPGMSFADAEPVPESEQASTALEGQLRVNLKSEHRTDILFVVDNSLSMSDIQKDISDRIPRFIEAINSLDWQIAVTTTDPSETTKSATGASENWGNGNFRTMQGKSFLKKGELSIGNAQSLVAEAINVGSKGSGDERGINSTYSAITKAKSQSPQKEFFRRDSRLVVVLISDEDECSNGSCLWYRPTSNPGQLLNLVQSHFGGEKIFKFNSIVKLGSSKCNATTVGKVYLDITSRTGGLNGDICATDYTHILSSIGQATLDLVKSVNLPCVAKAIQVFDANGVEVRNIGLSGKTVSFAANQAEGQYTINYRCY